MSKRKTSSKEDPQFMPEETDNRGTDHSGPRVIRDPNRGVPEKDTTTFQTKGGIRPDTHADQGTIGTINEAVTSGGGIAIDGGKLAGNRDDFEGDLGQRGPRPA
jgi:hypothetical protein